jgi:hypothetical protein
MENITFNDLTKLFNKYTAVTDINGIFSDCTKAKFTLYDSNNNSCLKNNTKINTAIGAFKNVGEVRVHPHMVLFGPDNTVIKHVEGLFSQSRLLIPYELGLQQYLGNNFLNKTITHIGKGSYRDSGGSWITYYGIFSGKYPLDGTEYNKENLIHPYIGETIFKELTLANVNYCFDNHD